MPFVVPQLSSSVDIDHDGKNVKGKVRDIFFKDDTYTTQGGYGSRAKVEVFVA